jgi:[CysO sulfur-carrier protein]-S-L-cysteine hydrolase
MRIARTLLDEIVSHAREEAPNECCGIIAGGDGRATSVHRASNALASPVSYEIEATDLYRIWKRIEEDGEELIAFYHSHVKAPPRPSQTDINWADNWPGASHLICSLGGEEPVISAFEIGDGRVEEVELRVE